MSNGSEMLDIAKFNLDAYKTAVELEIKKMEAYASFNLKMMQVVEQYLKNEKARLELARLNDAFQDYRIARSQAIRAARALQDKLERYTTRLSRLPQLVRGETATPVLTGLAWQAFWFLTSQAPPTAVQEMAGIKCTARDRKGTAFYKPSAPGETILDARSDIHSAFVLMDWARNKRVVPRIGTGPYTLLGQLLEILGDAAEERVRSIEPDLEEAQAEAKRIREAGWKIINIETEKPKQPNPAAG